MSNDPVRLTFSDGTELFTMGDGWSVISARLWDSEAEAVDAYAAMSNAYAEKDEKDPVVVQYYASVSEDDLREAASDAERVCIETKYGHPGWKEMVTFYCKASKSRKIITDGPSYGEGDVI